MGIQINGSTDTISASDGGLIVSGAELPAVININATGIVTATSFVGNVTGNATGLSGIPNIVLGIATVSAGSTSAPSITPTGDSNTGIFFPAADTIAFSEDGAESARFDSSGRLLIGTKTSRNDFFNNTTTVAGRIQLELSADNNLNRFFTFTSNNSDTGGPCLIFGKSRGTSANSKTIVQADDTIAQLSFNAADGSDMVPAAQIAAVIDGTPGANDMPGRLVFSTTADGASSPTERMRIRADGLNATFCAATTDGHSISSAASAGTTNYFIDGLHSASGILTGTRSFRVFTNGNVQNTNNSYGAISDIKLKENIVDASSQWDDLKTLQVRNYNFKEGQTHTQIGLIAQEVELVSPGLVSESPDRDAEGNELGTTTKSVNYSVLYMKAVKALQEAMERIETLEAQNADFAARISTLEGN
jgi:hypothetical protein